MRRWVLLAALGTLPVRPLQATEGGWMPLEGGRLSIEAPRVRAVAGMTPPARGVGVELRFTYEGPTQVQKPLQSGELRRQVGLKLRARDGCNVVYVMWRLAPVAGLVVSVKRNPGESRSDDCGNGGYRRVKSRVEAPLPKVAVGDSHLLRAQLQGDALQVWADGASVWEGTLPPEALEFDGPVGLRTDNGRFQVEFRSTP